MKKTNYINKYDYMNYYTKQPSFWFFSLPEILASLKVGEYELDHEDDSEIDDEAFDVLEYYKEQRDELIEINKNDPKIVEGNLLDKKSRQHIIDLYPNFKIVDFEDDTYRHIKQEEIAIKTKEIIMNENQVIFFQPVFIYNNLITKPDAVVKDDIEIKVFETKSTTTAKLIHFLDIFFQSKVISNQEYLADYYFEYNLCLSAYCYANRHEVPFITTNSINLQTALNLTGIPFEFKQSLKLGQGYVLKKEEFIEAPINITALCEGDFQEISSIIEDTNGGRRISLEKKLELIATAYNEFENVTNKLTEHLKNLKNSNIDIIKNIHPHRNDKSPWKAPDLFNDLRTIYIKQGYELFKYSGKVVNLKMPILKKLEQNIEIATPFNERFEQFFKNKKPSYIVDKNLFNQYKHLLNRKKVYFDFETISSPVRPINNCLPYSQIITQCSIIKDHMNNTTYCDMLCNNILFDPVNITVDDFKYLIDSLYEGGQYSYVVYNISFERSRLKELIEYINDDEYTQKINIIINNLFDLADFFNITKSSGAVISIKELYGFYSIKKVLKYIEDHYPEIFKITGCHDYKKLEISNGLVCQTETIKRFHNCMNQEQWNKLSFDLKKYCENDVRAMIAVELLAIKLVNE